MAKVSGKPPENNIETTSIPSTKTSATPLGKINFFPRLSAQSSEMRDFASSSNKTIEPLLLSNGSASFSLISTPKNGSLPVSVVIGENELVSSLYIRLPEEFSGEQNYSADLIHKEKSIGTVTISDYGDYIWVDHISNLTGKEYRGVGTALQEILVRYSLTQGYSGKVQLDAQGADSSDFHKHLGYEFLNGTTKGTKGAEQGEMYLPDMRIRQIINHNLVSD